MRILTKKKPSARLDLIREKLVATKEAVQNGSMVVEGNNVYLHSIYWKNKGRKFKKAFAKNIFMYVGIVGQKQFDPDQPVVLFDLEDKTKKISSFFKDKATIY